jgi:septal ring factor EnvC (AmiA/AmiB activator)
MTITTEEAERLAKACCKWGMDNSATTIRSLAAERDALKAENANLQDDLASAERERAHQQGRADRNAAEYAREQKKREQLQAENARLREAALDALAGLVAAHSLLERGGKKAAPSNKMFEQMLCDYGAAITRTRAALGEKE